MKVYIAGPMTGVKDLNFPRFFRTAEILADLDHDPINPADNDGPTWQTSLMNVSASDGSEWLGYMRRDIVRFAEADAVCVLPGWQNSRGAKIEVDLATALGLPIYCIQPAPHNETTRPSDKYRTYESGGLALVPRVRLLGLWGYQQVGKDLTATILATYNWERRGFADKIREAVYVLDPQINMVWSIKSLVDEVGWEAAKNFHPEVRRLLQHMGTEVGRAIDRDLWVKQLLKDCPDGSMIVCPDTRFPNEAKLIKNNGGEVWEIRRPGYGPKGDHESEDALKDWPFDAVLDNSGTCDDMENQIARVMGVYEMT